jgi:hypothetical protein
MADIKQAAKWMQEGKPVRRELMRHGGWFEIGEDGFIHWVTKGADDIELSDMIDAPDLLADDWEIAE